MEVGDLIVYKNAGIGPNRFWEVKSVCLGALEQESLVELLSLTEKAGVDVCGNPHRTTWVPEVLLRDMPRYNRRK